MQKLRRAMKFIPLLAAVLLLLAGPVKAQAAHGNTLTWAASTAAGATYNVYRSAGSCAGPFTKLNTVTVPALTFTDSGMADGAVNCYYVTAVVVAGSTSAESTQSNFVLCTTPAATAAPPITPPPGAVTTSSK